MHVCMYVWLGYDMLFYVMLCYPMLCYVMSCYVCVYIYIDIHAPCTHTCVRSHPEISSSARIQRGHCCENPRKKPEIETYGFQQIFPSIHSLKAFLGLVLDLPYRFWTNLAVPSVIHCCEVSWSDRLLAGHLYFVWGPVLLQNLCTMTFKPIITHIYIYVYYV